VRARHTRHVPGEMNKLEKSYAEYLEQRKLIGEVALVRFEQHKLKLADRTFYTPDFGVVFPDGLMEFHEVKGFWEEDARLKIKVAAEQFPEYLFIGVKWDKRQGWQYETF
jgi:hypothetical protein